MHIGRRVTWTCQHGGICDHYWRWSSRLCQWRRRQWRARTVSILRRRFVIVFIALGCATAPTGPTAGTIPPYDRAGWPHWVDADGDCQNTRQEVLIDESSLVPPRFSADGCRVVGGQWLDVYTGEVYVNPAMLDIDHVVSLAAAHRMGGWRWSRERKRAYANDLAHADHLVAVLARVNRQKGDRGPAAWLPPRARCAYVATYQAIAARWALTLAADDAAMIRRVKDGCQ